MPHLDPFNNSNDFDRLVDLISAPIHQKKRRAVVKSHLKYANHFVDNSKKEFVRFVTSKFLNSLKKGKEPSAGYIVSIVQSLQRHFGVDNFNKTDVYKTITALRKLYNNESTDPIFYSSTGKDFTIDKNNIKLPTKPKIKMYSDVEFDKIYNYYNQHLDNYLYSSKETPSIEDELSMIVMFFCSGPYRAGEVMGLTYGKALDLVLKSSTTIKSKSGTMVDDLIIPSSLGGLLERFIEKLPDMDNRSDKIFKFTYFQYYSAYKQNLKLLFSYDMSDRRAFHAFRNFFAAKADGVDGDTAKDALNHKTKKMTSMYINNQRRVGRVERIKKMMDRLSVR